METETKVKKFQINGTTFSLYKAPYNVIYIVPYDKNGKAEKAIPVEQATSSFRNFTYKGEYYTFHKGDYQYSRKEDIYAPTNSNNISQTVERNDNVIVWRTGDKERRYVYRKYSTRWVRNFDVGEG